MCYSYKFFNKKNNKIFNKLSLHIGYLVVNWTNAGWRMNGERQWEARVAESATVRIFFEYGKQKTDGVLAHVLLGRLPGMETADVSPLISIPRYSEPACYQPARKKSYLIRSKSFR